MNAGFFITGTDTGVGKTWISCALLHTFTQHGLRTAAMKPVAAGCHHTPDGWRNEDAELLRAHASVVSPYERVNPYALPEAVAPHIAAALSGQRIALTPLVDTFHALRARADCVIVEGAGGWLVPLNEKETLADLARALNLPVILVVGLRLGCLNHALLSARAIAHSGLPLAGWVANPIDPHMPRREENIETLRAWLPAPLLGVAPHLSALDAESLSACLAMNRLKTGFRDTD